MPKPSTTPTASVPLASPAQRPKFTFTIPIKNKGAKTDLNKAKMEEKELGEKNEKISAKDKLSSPSTEKAHSELKSPITSSEKKLETVVEPETTQTEAKLDDSHKEKVKEPSVESFPLKNQGKERAVSPSKKPRPPPLFIPRPLAQGKRTPLPAGNLPSGFC